jgi:hypothetical protein
MVDMSCFIRSPYFCKNGTTHKISVLQEKQGGGSVLRMKNALRGRTTPIYLGYSWISNCHLFTYQRLTLIERFTAHNLIQLKVQLARFYKTRRYKPWDRYLVNRPLNTKAHSFREHRHNLRLLVSPCKRAVNIIRSDANLHLPVPLSCFRSEGLSLDAVCDHAVLNVVGNTLTTLREIIYFSCRSQFLIYGPANKRSGFERQSPVSHVMHTILRKSKYSTNQNNI